MLPRLQAEFCESTAPEGPTVYTHANRLLRWQCVYFFGYGRLCLCWTVQGADDRSRVETDLSTVCGLMTECCSRMPPSAPNRRGQGQGHRVDGVQEVAIVVLIVIEDGGHTWLGMRPPVGLTEKSALNFSANDLMWEFFKKHTLK